MKKFKTFSSIAVTIPKINIDTDSIIPKQFLKTIHRTGLGKFLFYDLRYVNSENEKTNFILNDEYWSKAKILIAGRNFGCGSSREHAVWALLDFGIDVVIAPSFGDIFFNNCFKNGLLPITLSDEELDSIIELANNKVHLTINLGQKKVSCLNSSFSFEIDDFRKECMLEGLDDIDLTLRKEAKIRNFEKSAAASQPWVYKVND